eukprot:gene31693-42267_t
MTPIFKDGTVYPIEIKELKGFVKNFMPLIQLSLTALSLLNNVSALARLFGYPTPTLSSDVIQSLSDNLSDSTNVPKYK